MMAGEMRLRFLLAVVSLTVLVASAWPWGDLGHRAVVIVALRHCKPEIAAKIRSILQGQSLTYKDPVALATWPDHIRGTAEDRPQWHYADYGFSITEGIPPVMPEHPNAEERLNILLGSIPDATGGDAGRQMAWLFHLIGDIHQPLHASSLSSAQFPEGDRGGNSIQVRADSIDRDGGSHHSLQKLHHLWDATFDINTPNVTPESVADEADAKGPINVHIPSSAAAREAMLHTWLMESSKLAKEYAYPSDGPGSEWLKHREDLPPNYQMHTREIAVRRIRTAGYRLAALLDVLYKE